MTQFYNKSHYTNIQFKLQYKKKRHQKIDNAVIADRLRTVIWSDDSNQTGVVKPIFKMNTSAKIGNAPLIWKREIRIMYPQIRQSYCYKICVFFFLITPRGKLEQKYLSPISIYLRGISLTQSTHYRRPIVDCCPVC